MASPPDRTLRDQPPKNGDRDSIAADPTDPDDVLAELERILASKVFIRSERLSRFLRYIVEQALAGKQDELKEHTVARAAFDKPPSFDPRLDPIVRVEARRLRAKLLEYYDKHGSPDAVMIRLDRRGYVPRFSADHNDLANSTAGATENAELPAALGPRSAVAVLPFVDLSPSHELEYFCDGLTEEVINALTQVKGLQIVSRSSAFQFKGSAPDVRDVGEHLGVGAVMEGSVRQSGDRIRITAQLSSANDGFHLWSETYDGSLDDEFKIQEEISREIVKTLEGRKGESFAYELTKKHTSSARAYHQYLQGLYHRHSTSPHNLARGIECFEAAIEADPSYALAYSGLATCWCKLAWLQVSPPAEAWSNAAKAARKALELDEKDSSALAAMGAAYCAGEWNWKAGEQSLLRALESDACDPAAHHWYAVAFLAPRKRFDEAMKAIQQAVELGPRSLYVHNHLGLIYLYAGEYEKAIERHRRVLSIKTDFVPALWDIGRAYEQVSDLDKAEDAFRRALETSGGLPLMLASLGHCLALKGQTEEACKIAQDIIKLSEENYVSALDVVRVYAGLGKTDEAFHWLDKAVEERSARLIELDIDPMFRPLSEDSRIEKVRSAMGLTA